MFPGKPLPNILVKEFSLMTTPVFARSLTLKSELDADEELLRLDVDYRYGEYDLGSASLLYRKKEKTLEITGFYPFEKANNLRARGLAVIFYQKLLAKVNPYLENDARQITVIPNRVNTPDYVAFLEKLGFDGRAPFPYQTLFERSLLAARKRSSIASFVLV